MAASHSSTSTTVACLKKRSDDINPTVTAKRQRRDNDNVWLQIPDDVLAHILLMASKEPKDLMGLEASCRTLQETTCRCWSMLAKDKYGIESFDDATTTTATTGKDLWNEGRTLESLSVERSRYVYFRNADHDVFRQGVFFGCNESIFVMSSSDHNAPYQQSGGFVPQSPIRIRDAKTLKILANMDGTVGHKAIDVMGPSGNELIVEYMDDCMKAYRNCQVVWEHKWRDPFETDVWCLLSSEKAVLVFRNQHLHVFVLTESAFLLHRADTLTLEDLVEVPTMNWLNEGIDFVLQVRKGELSFWNITTDKHKLVKNCTLKLSVKKIFNYVYAGSKHLVASGAQDDDGVYVFDKRGMLLHRLIEDMHRPSPRHSWSPMNCCVLNGCLLVTNSLMGAALCVWNMRTGKIVHRFEQSIEKEHMFRPGEHYSDGTVVQCMDQLPSFDFPFFLLTDHAGSMFSWGFPSDKDQIERMQMLAFQAARENRLSRRGFFNTP